MATEHVVICDPEVREANGDNVSAYDQEIEDTRPDPAAIEAALLEQRRMDAVARMRRVAGSPDQLGGFARDLLLVLGLDE